MNPDSKIILKWHGAAHYHIYYKDLIIIIDPLYSRLPGDKPHLEATPEDIDSLDYLLLTHGHLDHSWDLPVLVSRHNSELFAPEKCLKSIEKLGSSHEPDSSKWHSLEKASGVTFGIDDIEMTPFRIGTEKIDFWFIRSMFIRPWIHGKPTAIRAGLRWLTHHVSGNCFAYHFRFPAEGRTMLYFGNLTGQVEELRDIENVDVLAIPYCPANRKWLQQSVLLIERFKPGVTLVHHFDNFLNPFTLSKYMNLDSYRKAIHDRLPGSPLYFSKFNQEVSLADIAGLTGRDA